MDRSAAAHEDAEDFTAFLKAREALASGEDELLPSAAVKRVLAGENPIRVFREHRGLSVKALAQAAGVSAAYMGQIENGKREGRFSIMAAIAKALDMTLDDLA